MQVLEELGTDMHTRAQNGGTALHAAAAQGHVQAIEALEELGADIHMQAQVGLLNF